MNNRTYLEPGSRLQTEDGRILIIKAPMGQGGTALTYQGEELIEGQESVRILLKELYPRCEGIERRPDGTIEGCDLRAKMVLREMSEAMEREQELGNQIAKQEIPGIYPMTCIVRDVKTGNQYGLFYQCPPSMSLKAFVEAYGSRLSLHGKIRLAWALSRQMEVLHGKGNYSHRDISSGNVLVISALFPDPNDRFTDWSAVEAGLQAGLIDFACAAKIGQEEWGDEEWNVEDMRFHTDGYSAAELYEEGSKITETADIYSVAACLWFLLTGHPPKTEDGHAVLDEREWEFLQRSVMLHELCALSGDVRIVFERNPNPVPLDVVQKLTKILGRGLAERENRYGSMEMLTERLYELLALIEGASVSWHILAERAAAAYAEKRKELRADYQIQEELLPLVEDGGVSVSIKTVYETGKSLYVIGDGGAGKTTSVFWFVEKTREIHAPVIPIYVELNRIPVWNRDSGQTAREYWLGKNGRPDFLERYLAGIYYGCPGKMAGREDFTAAAMKRQLERRPSGEPTYLVMMDGLNEMAFSSRTERLVFAEAVNWYLEKGRNLRIILTSRYDDVGIATERIRRVKVTGLSDAAILACLKADVRGGRMPVHEYERLERMDHSENLWKCFRRPLFFMMYRSIEKKDDVVGAGDILRQYFHEKREAVDGRHGYSERVVGEEKYRGRMFTEGLSMELAGRLVMDFVLPEIGLEMAERQRFFMDQADMVRLVEERLCLTWAESVIERYGYHTDMKEAQKRLLAAGAERILGEVCVKLGILSKSGEVSYYFTHQYYRDYFAAVGMVHRLEAASAGSEALSFMRRKRWPESVLRLCGEYLGVHHTVPEYDGVRWVQNKNWDPLFDKVLRLCTAEFWKPDCRWILDKQGEKNYFTENVLEILRLCRRYRGCPDFSGIDLSGISLHGADIKDVIFSHPEGENGMFADLRNTGIGTRGFRMKGYWTTWLEYCLQDTYLAPDGAWLLETKETSEGTYLEEKELFGAEVRELGFWGKCLRHFFSPDGQTICFLDEQKTISFYDRATGATVSDRLSQGRVRVCDWCGDTFVLLEEEEDHSWIRYVKLDENGQIQKTEQCLDLSLENITLGCIGKERNQVFVGNDFGIDLVTISPEGTLDKKNIPLELAYMIEKDRKHQRVYLLLRTGELYVLEMDGTYSFCGKAEIFKDVRGAKAHNGRLFLWTFQVLYEWDFAERFLKVVRSESKGLTGHVLSLSEQYGVWENGTIFRIKDGETVQEGIQETREQEGNQLVWLSPASEEDRLWLLECDRKILYRYRLTEHGELVCAGYRFPNLGEELVHAIYVDSGRNLLAVCADTHVGFYDLMSGERDHQMQSFDLIDAVRKWRSEEQGSQTRLQVQVKEACFAPGGECLELKIEYWDEAIGSYAKKTRIIDWEYRTGTITERYKGCEDEEWKLGCLVFDREDILSGKDSGRRYPQNFVGKTGHQAEPEPGIIKKLKQSWDKIGGRKSLMPRGKMSRVIFFDGKSYGGIGTEGDATRGSDAKRDFLLWDADRAKMVCYRNVIPRYTMEYGTFLPFEHGFLIVEGLKVTRYILDKRTVETRYAYQNMELLTLGCPAGDEKTE